MKTMRVRRPHGDKTITVTRTKTGRIVIYETDCFGVSTTTTVGAFEALEARVREIRAMINDVTLRQLVAEGSR